jgi:hypothetical protein
MRPGLPRDSRGGGPRFAHGNSRPPNRLLTRGELCVPLPPSLATDRRARGRDQAYLNARREHGMRSGRLAGANESRGCGDATKL